MKRATIVGIACALLAVTARAQFAPQTWPADQDGANFICADVGYFQANNLAGVGTRFACTDPTGKLVASATPCVASGAVVSSVTGGGGLVCSPTTGAVACTLGTFACSAGDFVSSSSTGGLACTAPAYSHWSDGTFSPLPQEPLSTAGAGLSIADDPSDGATVISLPPTGSAGSCTNCSVTFDLFGRETARSSGTAGADALATYEVTSSSHAPVNAVNLGALASGVNEQVTTAGTAAPLTYQCVPGEVQFGAASGGGLAQSTLFTYNGSALSVGTTAHATNAIANFYQGINGDSEYVLSNDSAGTSALNVLRLTRDTPPAIADSLLFAETGTNYLGCAAGGVLSCKGALFELEDSGNFGISDYGSGNIVFATTTSRLARMVINTNGVVQFPFGYLQITATTPPGAAPSGTGYVYEDSGSTLKNLMFVNDAGVVNHGAQDHTSVAGNALSGLNPDGSWNTLAFQAPLAACTDYVSLSCVSGATDLGGTNATPTVIGIESTAAMRGDLVATAITSPGTPAAGKGIVYFDSTSKNWVANDDAGHSNHGVRSGSCGANTYFSAFADAGTSTCSSVAFSGLTGSASCSQLPAFTGDVTTTAGTCGTTLASVITPGTYGNSGAYILSETVDAKGRATAFATSTTPISSTLSWQMNQTGISIGNNNTTLVFPAGGGSAIFLTSAGGSAVSTVLAANYGSSTSSPPTYPFRVAWQKVVCAVDVGASVTTGTGSATLQFDLWGVVSNPATPANWTQLGNTTGLSISGGATSFQTLGFTINSVASLTSLTLLARRTDTNNLMTITSLAFQAVCTMGQ